MKTLEELRRAIDGVDDEIVAALNRRFALVAEAQALKRAAGGAAKDPAREAEILKRVLTATPPAERDTVCAVYERLFGGARGVVETIARGVVVKDGKVLLCKAKGGASTYLPGGHIEFGETGRVALEREIREELGCASTAGAFLGVVENAFLQHGKPHAEINLVYRLELADDAAVAREDWIEFEWCPLDDLDRANLLPTEIKGLICSEYSP